MAAPEAKGVVAKGLTYGDRAGRNYGGFIIFLCILLLFSLVVVLEEHSGTPRSFYVRCLDQKIAQCEPGAWMHGADVRASFDEALKRARFFEEERERLLSRMEAQNLGKDPQAVEHFLRKAYSEHLQDVALLSAQAGLWLD